MSVDWYNCANCNVSFNDCGHFFGCDCGEMFCCAECGDKKGDCGDDVDPATCKICRGEVVTDEQLLEYLIEKSGLTRVAHVEAIMKSREK